MASYAVGVLRQFLAEGEWQEQLPGERALALRIGVSRPTLHEALLQLEKEGAVRRRPKAAWQILATAQQAARGPRKVIFLSPLRLEDVPVEALLMLMAVGRVGKQHVMRRYAARGYVRIKVALLVEHVGKAELP
jgi:DNA-binding transcriptional MocR family regulator